MTQHNIKFDLRKITATKAWLSVVRAYNLCDAAMNARLSDHGLRVGEHEVLANLQQAPGITQQVLAKRCFVAKSGISMLLTRMESQGLLRREADARDGRIKRLYLSQSGVALALQTMAIQDQIVEHMMTLLSDSELAVMADLSKRVAAQLENLEDN